MYWCTVPTAGILLHHTVRDEEEEEEAYSEQLPGIGDGLLLEIVPKGPIAQHLKEGVVIHILAHIIQVIVFASSSYALHSI